MDSSLIIVGLCGLLSFAFSAAETALTSLGRLETQTLIGKGGAEARLIQLWIKDERRWLTTILIGNNVANIVGSSLITLWATAHESKNVEWVIAVFTVFVIIFSEILPKLWANEWSDRIAPMAMRFLRFAELVLRPATIVVKALTSRLVVTSGMPGRELHRPISEAELEQTIELATKGGGIDRETGEALSNVIEFPDLVARDVMLPRSRIQAVSVNWTLDEILRFVMADGHSRYPVIHGSLDGVVGILLVKDLIHHFQRSPMGSWTRVIRKPYFISEIAPLRTVLRDMKRLGIHMALVRNETGVLTGLLTLEEILEEIVGEIRDETDDPGESGSGFILGPSIVSGEISILDFNDRFRASLPIEGSYSTLNGFLLSRTGGQLPPVGTLIFTDDLSFRIHSVSDKGIATIEIVEPAKPGV